MSFFDNFFNTTDRKVIDILPIREYKEHCFVMKDGRLMDILQIRTKNLVSATEDEVEFDILTFTRFYKTFADDVKIIGLNFATDTKKQQAFIRHKLVHTHNLIYKRHLEEKLEQLIYIEKNRTDREYYLMFFSDDELKYKDNITVIQKSLSGLTDFLDKKKKLDIFFKVNNKNTSIFV